ncbi:MAG: hypothetical protein IPO67_12715 [Deltaproteobacteria bacterium]|nr:hypothetical protein [Deltaproteobacteria bacterium]
MRPTLPLCMSLGWLLPSIAWGEPTLDPRFLPPPPPAVVQDVAAAQLRVDRVAMGTLGSWAAVNLVAGTAGAFALDDPRARAFAQGSAAWNVVNAGLAVGGLRSANRRAGVAPSWPSLALEGERSRGVFLLNAGLDVGYMAAGLWLRERGARVESPQLQGYGDALLVQGGFLFAFDLTMVAVKARADRPLAPFVQAETP